MIERNGKFGFGFFKGMPYATSKEAPDDFNNFRNFKNKIPKEKIIQHIETSAELGLTSAETRDIFTNEELQAGIYWDGNFVFPADFLHYLKNYDIGVPYEYEEYLTNILHLDE